MRGGWVGRVAIDVAGELVEEKEEGDGTLRGRGPVVEVGGVACKVDKRGELGADLIVESRAIGVCKPLAGGVGGGQVGEPEIEDAGGFWVEGGFGRGVDSGVGHGRGEEEACGGAVESLGLVRKILDR